MRQGGEQPTSLWMYSMDFMKKCFNVIFTVLVALAFLLLLPDPPENANTPPLQHTQVMVGAPFSPNCTPSAANLRVDTVSISGQVTCH